jgi:geranylgeranyl reductase family protein
MHRCDALIVGGGPAGSTCARVLRRAGWQVIVIDRARFPRDKVCGGWVTPGVFRLLELDPAEYRAAGFTIQKITGFQTSVIGRHPIETRYPSPVSYAIRRCEFDDYLLRRAAVRVLDGTALRSLRQRGGAWIVNDTIAAPIVIGAGGHFCPVARYVQGERDRVDPIIAQEAEFKLDGQGTSVAQDTPELFFSSDLEGYGWCVRKDDYLNIGIGRRLRHGFGRHVGAFATFLATTGRVPSSLQPVWRGHAYHAAGAGRRPLVGDGLVIIGDAAGLAFPESGEGIRPAVESGVIAAQVLLATPGQRRADDLRPYERTIRARYPPATPTPAVLRPLVTAAGRVLLRSEAFTRHIVVDRWFLRNRLHALREWAVPREDANTERREPQQGEAGS